MADLTITTELGKPSTKQAQDAIVKAGRDAGEKGGREVERGFSDASRRIRGVYVALASTIASVFAVGKVTQLAAVQEDAINRLNTSLALSGQFSQDASQRLQEFASSLQNTSRFGDEVILNNTALIQSLGQLDEQGLKRATTAAVNLAAALNIDLQRASILVGRAAQGQVESFRELGITVQKGADNAQTFNNALSILEQRFGGAAQSSVQTFSGALVQAQNAFGDLLEEIGFFITNSPLITRGLQIATQAFQFAGAQVREFANNFNFIEQVAVPLSRFAQNIIKFVVTPLEIITNVVRRVFEFVAEQITTFVNFIIEQTRPLTRILSAIGSDVGNVLVGITEQINAFAGAQNEGGFFAGFLDTSFSDKLRTQLEGGVVALQDFNAQAGAQAQAFKFNFQDTVQESVAQTAVAVSQTAQQVNQAINQGFVRAVSGGIQNIVQSLAAGENVFANFGKFILNTFGDLAIQIGQVLLASGKGIAALITLGPAATIAAGAGLIAIGAILKAASGGGGSTSSPTSTGGSNFAPVEPATNVGELSDPQGQRREEQASVNLTIQGDVFDSEDSGLRIAKLINSAAGKTGVVLRNTRTV